MSTENKCCVACEVPPVAENDYQGGCYSKACKCHQEQKDTSDPVERVVDAFINDFLPTDLDEQLEEYTKEELDNESWSIRAYAVRKKLRTTLHSLLEAERERIIAHIEEHGHATYNELTGDIEGWTLYGSLDQLTPNPNSQ